jgi:hypothetical protein
LVPLCSRYVPTIAPDADAVYADAEMIVVRAEGDVLSPEPGITPGQQGDHIPRRGGGGSAGELDLPADRLAALLRM